MKKEVNLYVQFKNNKSKKFDNIDIKYAFSKDQQDEMLKAWGIARDEGPKYLVSVGAGGYMKKADLPKLKEFNQQYEKDRAELMKNDTFVLQMLRYELANHEYCITGDPSDTLDACQLNWDEVSKDERLLKLFTKAEQEYLANSEYF